MSITTHERTLHTDDFAPHRIRSAVAIAAGSAVPASASALLVTGSGLAGVLIAAFTIICVGLAAVMI